MIDGLKVYQNKNGFSICSLSDLYEIEMITGMSPRRMSLKYRSRSNTKQHRNQIL